MLRSLEQERARYAWNCINLMKSKNRRSEDEKSGLFEKIVEEMKKRRNREISEEEIRKYYETLEERYSSYIKKMPTLIQNNGLGNTLAFYRSKFGSEEEEKLSPDKRAYKLIYVHLNEWVNRRFKYNEDILRWIISKKTSPIDVFKVTKETIALLNWMKRFTEAELKGEEHE